MIRFDSNAVQHNTNRTIKLKASPNESPLSSNEVRDHFRATNLEHIVTTSVKPEDIDTPEERTEVSKELIALMREYPHASMAVGVVTGQTESQAIVASRADAVGTEDTVGVYEFVQRIGNSPSIKAQARAYPTSYQTVQPFDKQGLTDLVRLPGAHDPETLTEALAEGGATNNQAMLEELISSLPKGKRGVLLIGGPSGAGKSHLIRNLRELAGDRNLVTIEGDNYFRDVDDPDYPRLDNDQHYFDHYNALDQATMKANFQSLIEEGQARVPIYDFGAIHGQEQDWDQPVRGVRVGYRDLELNQDDILVFDSLHATNSDLTGYLREKGLPVVSVYLDTPSANDRLVRRIVRDYHHRGGITPEQSMEFWDNTTRLGETEFIRPSMKDLDPVKDVFLITEFEGEPHISRSEISKRSEAMKNEGLMPEYEAYNRPANRMDRHALKVKAEFIAILADRNSSEEAKEKARKGLDMLEQAQSRE